MNKEGRILVTNEEDGSCAGSLRQKKVENSQLREWENECNRRMETCCHKSKLRQCGYLFFSISDI